jgi:hypothetical protein
MALDTNALRDALVVAFEQGMDDPGWTKEDAAQAMADAIDAFVRGADVLGIEVDVVDAGNTHIGTGTQIGTGRLE